MDKGFEVREGKGVAPPRMKPRRSYPFEEMEINDYFDLVPYEEESLGDVKRKVVGAMSNYGRVYKKKFQAEIIPNEGLVRVWRIELE